MRAQLQPSSQRGIYLGLGSNLGDRLAHLDFAKRHFTILAESPVYISPAMLPEGAPNDWNKPYFNQVIEIETSLNPHELLAELKHIEEKAGRKDRGRWAPRELDIDILAYGAETIDAPELKLPHAGIAQRDFVLLPLRDIAPKFPVINEMIAKLPSMSAMPWRKTTQIMGILNITPDSFSDGGAVTVKDVITKFKQLVRDGADIIDIGAESTRPGATPLNADEEWQRLEAPLKAICQHPLRQQVLLSIDTRHAQTAKHAIDLGVDWINDVSGLSDPAMVEVLRDALCDVVVMHSLTVPADKNVTLAADANPIAEVLKWKAGMECKGIAPERLIFDPGIGFGKTAEQSLALIEHAEELVKNGGRWLIGHSRKSFIKGGDRDVATLAYSRELVAQAVDYLRVHDVAGHRDILARAIEDQVNVPGIELGLERLQSLLTALGNPELKMPPVIHLAGTNGKGSTLAYLKAIYEAAGKRVHAYSSPHLVHYNERVILAGQEVSDAQLMKAILRVRALEVQYPITVFERITAAAYLCFSEVPADILLLETGMGGRLDATNIPPKIATILTPIAMDHMEFLGDSLAKITAEKAAIMRPDVPCFAAEQADEAKLVIAEYAMKHKVPLTWVKTNQSIEPALVGDHQKQNASLAAEAARALGISEAAIQTGIAQAQWPARLQKLERGPFVKAWGKRGNVMLDGGHNIHAAAALVAWIKAQDRPVVLVCGMMARKNAAEWMRLLIPHVSEVICAPISGQNAYHPEQLAKQVQAGNVRVAPDFAQLEGMLRVAPVTPAHILIAGSLYLAGDILKTHG